MNKVIKSSVIATVLVWTMSVMPLVAIGQTRIVAPKNKYSVQDDIKLGRQAAAEVEKQFPMLNDRTVEQEVEQVGQRLVAAIPPQFQHPEFNYRFEVVNASDINAFALPGGPMYVNRGMIEAARNEGEMAGVMAHEISHVALRHATAQATKQRSFGSQLGVIGMVLGGAILGGQAGAQLGALGAQAWMTKYSREYETQADILGAQIMANAGYDPRDLANMFQTIERQGGSRGPEWLSSHPDPGNRFQNINREASLLRVSPNPIKTTAGFERAQSNLRGYGPAPTMQQIEQGTVRTGGRTTNPTAGGNYSRSVPAPSSRTRVYSTNWIQFRVPDNWEEFSTGDGVTFAPQGAYGDNGITHGVMVATARSNSNDPYQATQDVVNSLLQGNTYLRQQSQISQTNVGGGRGYSTVLSGTSSITGRREVVTLYTAPLDNGDLLYIATVAPGDASYAYNNAFRSMINSIRLGR
jgi:Zn-dependent protease with chaperone function